MLLGFLGVEGAALEEQRTAVAAWLTRNKASSVLLASLRAAGLTPGRD
jgi:hypothetical protein